MQVIINRLIKSPQTSVTNADNDPSVPRAAAGLLVWGLPPLSTDIAPSAREDCFTKSKLLSSQMMRLQLSPPQRRRRWFLHSPLTTERSKKPSKQRHTDTAPGGVFHAGEGPLIPKPVTSCSQPQVKMSYTISSASIQGLGSLVPDYIAKLGARRSGRAEGCSARLAAEDDKGCWLRTCLNNEGKREV